MQRTIEHAKALAAKLRAMPAIENKQRPISKQQEITLLAGEIKGLQQRNYSLEQIAGILTQNGVSITSNTLRNYLQRSKAPAKRKPQVAKAAVATQGGRQQADARNAQKQLGCALGEIVAPAIAQASVNGTSAAAAIARPDRQRL